MEGYTPDRRGELLEPPAATDESPAGSQPGNEVGDAALGLLPYLFRGGPVVRSPIGGVVVLVGVEVSIRLRGGELAGLEYGAVGSFQRVGLDDIGTIGPENLLSCLTGIGGQAEAHRVTLRRPQHGESDPGIATRCLEDGPARLEEPFLLSIPQHGEAGAVLDRTAWVEPLGFRVNRNPCRRSGGRPHPQQGGSAHHAFQTRRSQRNPYFRIA